MDADPLLPAQATPRRVVLVGTGHVFDIGARVKDEIRRRGASIVAIELDPARYHALRSKNKDRRGTPLVYRMLADFQARIADQYGVEAGGEMLAAADEARAMGVPLALVDRDAQVTFQKLIREMGIREKFRFAASALVGLVLPGRSVEKQVDEMQEDYSSYFEEVGKKFPTIKRVLLDERNVHMARALSELTRSHALVVAVLGDGHVDGIRDILASEGIEIESVRLKELRATPPPAVGTATATISWDVPAEGPPPR